MNFYKHHLGDYDSATMHLSWLEDMAYTRLLRLYYRTEQPINPDIKQVFRLVRATSKAEREAVQTVLDEFFTLESDGWHQDRCDQEIGIANDRADKNREVGKLGGRPRKEKTQTVSKTKPTENPNGFFEEPTENPSQTPDSRHQNKHPCSPQGDDGFATFWQSYPKKVGKGAAEKAWAKAKVNGHAGEVLQSLEAQKRSDQWTRDDGRYIPNPATWLNQRRWEDQLQTATAGAEPNPWEGAT